MKNNIRNLKTDDNGWFTTGQFDSESFLPGEMNIMIFTDDGASIEDADRCIEHFNSLAGKSGVLDAVEEGLEKFFFITPWINHLKSPYINALILSYQNKTLMFRFPGAVTLDTISHFPALLRIYDQARIR